MRISYETNGSKTIKVIVGETEYLIYPGDNIVIDAETQRKTVCIYTQKSTRYLFLKVVLLFIGRFFLNILNVIFMNFEWEWYFDVDPYTLKTQYISETDDNNIMYAKTKIYDKTFLHSEPAIYINGIFAESEIDVDLQAIKNRFVEWCIDVVTVFSYCIAIISFICIFSKAIIIYVILLVIIVIPMLVKIFRGKKMLHEMLRCF